MTWRGRSGALDRFWACLLYALPMLDALQFMFPFAEMFPAIAGLILVPLMPIIRLVSAVPFGSFILFIAVFMLVVRNPRINHFIRYNAAQAIILGIAISLISIVWSLVLGNVLGGTFLQTIIFNVVFLGTLIAVIYAIVQCIRGLYAEIPVISEAAYTHTRY